MNHLEINWAEPWTKRVMIKTEAALDNVAPQEPWDREEFRNMQ